MTTFATIDAGVRKDENDEKDGKRNDLRTLWADSVGQNTVVKTVDSPNGTYYAQVIDSDQGALGRDTLVDVYEHKKLNAILFTIQKKPQRVYTGDWRDYENMQIYWRNDYCLVINGSENRIK